MPSTKRRRQSKQNAPATAPAASRPRIPAIYGVPKHTRGLLPWSHVVERMTSAMHYWICTAGPGGRPHATPVDGLWLDDRLYFGGSADTRRNRNLAAKPAVCVHLESGSDVVILHGTASELRGDARALALRLADASKQKYGYTPEPEAFTAGGTYVFRPSVVFAWTSLPKDATRWRLSQPNE